MHRLRGEIGAKQAPDKSAQPGERILVVDDEPDIVALVAYHLARAGYRVSTASTGLEALQAAREEQPAMVVLDLMLPELSGFEVLERIRADKALADIPVLMLTARREEPDRVQGLSLGADDYLVKPFSPQELVLRVRNILRRSRAGAGERGNVIRLGNVTVDKDAHTVARDGQPLELTATEYKLLITLADRRGRVQSRAQLLELVWESAPDIQTRTVDMHVQRLRAKLGDAGELIETVRGFGYRLKRTAGDY
ncbi:MAG TPA: response regulator transcription factor [Gemmatimonadaceae bacterium]|nr:response regulator transcription factor [Gemmatimonadaceae bacterium]